MSTSQSGLRQCFAMLKNNQKDTVHNGMFITWSWHIQIDLQTLISKVNMCCDIFATLLEVPIARWIYYPSDLWMSLVVAPLTIWILERSVCKLLWGGNGFLSVWIIFKHSITQKTVDWHSIQLLQFTSIWSMVFFRIFGRTHQTHLSGQQILGWRAKRWCVEGANCEEIGGTEQNLSINKNELAAEKTDEFHEFAQVCFRLFVGNGVCIYYIHHEKCDLKIGCLNVWIAWCSIDVVSRSQLFRHSKLLEFAVATSPVLI